LNNSLKIPRRAFGLRTTTTFMEIPLSGLSSPKQHHNGKDYHKTQQNHRKPWQKQRQHKPCQKHGAQRTKTIWSTKPVAVSHLPRPLPCRNVANPSYSGRWQWVIQFLLSP